MTDPVQMVPSTQLAARVPAVRPDAQIAPARHAPTDNRSSNDNRGEQSLDHHSQPERHLTISRHDTLQTFVYRSIEEESGDVVWQYPSENMLRMSEKLKEMALEQQHQLDERA